MSDSVLDYEHNGDVVTIRLDRPKRFNALNRDLLAALRERTREAAHDDGVRAVVVTGTDPAFCAGGDLGAIREEGAEELGPEFHHLAGVFHEAIVEIRTMDKAVVGAINGPAVGGGLSLALVCDVRLIAEGAYLRVGYTSNGLTLDGGGSWALPRLIGLGRASEMAMFDDEVPPDEAVELGLGSRVVDADDLAEEARELAERFADMPTETVGRTKRLFNRAFDNSLERHLEEERRAIATSADSPEGREGIEAFLEKRQADYRDLD
ncbi:MAG: enoyl-CoA hydratase/isomerase family protein [Bradymonadaceae bacterium]